MVENTSLAPSAVSSRAKPRGRFGVAFGHRFLLLLVLGLAWLAPGLVQPRFLYGIVAWDTVLLLLWAMDLSRLPRPEAIEVTRSWASPAALSVRSEVSVTIYNHSSTLALIKVIDDVPFQLRSAPPSLDFFARPHNEVISKYTIAPSERGTVKIGYIHLRLGSVLGLAERWAVVPLEQPVTVFPNLAEAKQHVMYMVRSRQIELEKRYVRLRGQGREFESLREYRSGDEFRDICWTATARRAKLVTKTFQVERSQAIWVVVDVGRLMRARVGALSKVDYAVNAALTLSEVALYSGDRVGLLAYGRAPQVRVPLARGSAHLRQLVCALASVREEAAEADHLRAAGMLGTIQNRRSLVVWITDLAETAVTPEVVEAVSQLTRRHLVLFVVIGQTDLEAEAMKTPETPHEMYRSTAAQEVAHRRDLLLARMRAQGVLALQTDSSSLSPLLVNEYLMIKEKNQI
jgi:uncharacterized protein (DUF58 family)